jgi:hypothetical protein
MIYTASPLTSIRKEILALLARRQNVTYSKNSKERKALGGKNDIIDIAIILMLSLPKGR